MPFPMLIMVNDFVEKSTNVAVSSNYISPAAYLILNRERRDFLDVLEILSGNTSVKLCKDLLIIY